MHATKTPPLAAAQPGWVMLPYGLVWGADGRDRIDTILAIMSIFGPDRIGQLDQPDPPEDHEHLPGHKDPCSCQAIWMSGPMPPTRDLPGRPGTYVCFDAEARPAYVGTSRTSVKARLLTHNRDASKPTLDRWLAFWPSKFGDSAAIWEIRLIEWLEPYVNRQHAGADPVAWEPRPELPPVQAWWERDPYYQRYVAGPGALFWPTGTFQSQIAATLRRLIDDEGFTWEEITEACEITAARDPRPDRPFPYMIGVLRQRALES